MPIKSFKDIFGDKTIGQMWKNTGGLIYLQDSPLNNLRLNVSKDDGKLVTGTLVLDGSEFQSLPWIKATAESSVTLEPAKDGGAFDVQIPLARPELSFFKETPIKSAALRLTNTVEKPEAKDQKERRYSSSELVMTMRPKIMNKDIIIRLDLFQGGGFTHFEGSIPEGMSLPDGLSVLSEFLGVPTDFAEYIPEGMEFLDAAKLFSLSFAIDNNKEAQTLSLPKLREMSFEIGINGNLFSVFEPYLQFRDPRLMISYLNGEKGWSDGLVSGYIGGQFVIGNKKLNKDLLVLDTVASYPVFDFEISQEGSLSAKDLAECFGWKLPTVIEEAKIEGISAYISPSEKSFQAGFQVTDAFNFSDVLKLENISLDFSYGNELFGLDLAALLNIESGGKNLLSLSAEASIESSGYISVHASFYNRESSLYGFDEPNISISEIYKALFKSELPAGFPAIEIRRFELDFSTGQNSMLTANSYGLSLDASVLLDTVAKGLKAETKIKISNNEIDLNGAFLLNISSGLNLEFGLSYKSQSGKPGNVGFHFMFDRIKVNLLYDANAKKLSGNVNLSSYTLGEAASFITKLFNPEFSLGHSDEWGFLYNMKLPDTSFSYDMENKSLTVMFTVAKSLPFLTLEKAGIKLDKNGVRFVVVGKFLDTAYTEKTPLTWDTSSSPPPTAGKLLDVSYLALANNVEVQTKGQYFIDRLKSLKEQLPVNYEPSELTLSPKAGYLFALDSRIMDTLDIRLMYYEGGPVLGAGFKLSGPKAAPLSGLEADILYAKVNETVGLFSGRVIPPDILRNIVLGTISVGIGDVAVQIYTNGDFYIDLGFPHNSDFSRSFFLQYTVFVGRGGIWVRRDTLGNTPGLPARSDGYYSPVLGCGIGLQIGLERGFSVSMLSAKLSLTLAGIFEGTFATFLKYNGGSDLYYKVRAYCALSGNLSGSINFGPVGAGVSIGIHTGMNLVIESNMPTIIDLFLQVYAQASVRIGWFNVYFSCNLSFSQQFRLGQKDIFGALPHYPDMLEFPSVNDNTPYPVKLFVLPVLSSLHGENVAVFLPAMSREDFAAIVNKLAGLAIYNNCLEDIGGFGIFIERPLFRNDFDLERFLADNFLFTLDFNQLNQGEDNGDETQVFMPMPPFVTIQCLNISRNLEKEHPVDEGYLEAMRKYYMAMEDRDDYSGIRYDYSENKTLSYHIFSEYFEIILRMLRSEKAKSLRENRVFDGLRLTDDQLDNIIGGTMRFLFGGKRVPDTDNMKTRLGFFNAAGQQFSLSSMDSDNHMGVIRLSEGVPCWLKLSGGLDSVSTDLLKLEPYLPPVNPPPADQIFLTKPYMTTPYTVNGFTEVLLSKTVLFKDKFTALPLSERGTGRLAEIPKNGIGFGSIIRFGAERSFIASDGDIAVYELNAYDNTDELESLLSKGCGTLEAELFYLSDGGSGEYHSCKTYPVIAVTEGISQDEHMYADLLDQPIRFLELLRLSYKLDGSFSLIMPPGSGVGEAEAQNFALLVKEKEELGIRKEWHNCYLAVPETPELTLKYESEESYPSVYQGFAVINAAIAKPGANAGRHDYLDSYRSLMAVLTDKGVPVSTETMPVFEVSETREDADKAHISLSIPYYRFIGDGGDVYAGIGGAAETEANLYLVDLLGNESEPVAKCTGRACYTDFLVPIGDYPGLNVSFCLETSGGGDMLTVLFRYRKAEHEDEYTKMSFAECVRQFAQTDAALRLYSPLLSSDKEGVLLDKQGLLEFLYACAKQTEPEELFFTQKAPLSPRASGIVSCEARLVMSRNRELCHKEAPADVYHAVSSIDYAELSKSPDRLKLPSIMEPLAVPGYLKAFSRVKIIKDKDNYSCIFLEHEMPVTLQKPRIWAWADLPVYSGLLDNDTGLCAERLDLQGILQNAWDDLNSLLSHARLREYKRNNALELIDRAMKLRRMFSSILADNGFKPLYDERDIGENEYKSVGRYIENALARDFAFPFRQVILAQAPYNCTSVCEAGENKILAVAKWGNCKSYDGTIDLSQERGYFCAACAGESGGPEANESPARLQIHSIERHAGGSADTFETADPAFWNTEAPGFSVKSPDRSLPYSPVFISQERKQEARTAVTVFQWAAVHNDHLNIVISPSSVRRELRANAAKNIDGVSDVYDMYKYNESRPGLIEGGAGVLMDALGHYLSALERFMGQRKHSGHSDNGGDYGSIWTVYAENGYLSRIECENAAAGTADISLSYQIGMGEKIAMHREGAVYRFEKDKAPAEGQPFVIFLTIENSENVSCELRAFRREEGMTDHFTRRTAFVGNAIEEGDSLV